MSLPLLAHRSVKIPRLLRLVHGSSEAVDALAELQAPGNATALLVHSGSRSPTGYGRSLLQDALGRGLRLAECVVDANTEESTRQVVERINQVGPQFVVGVGGGRVLDAAKLAAARSGVDFISVPTQASSDGMCSPVAVIVTPEGKPTSVGARIPAGIIVDMDAIGRAPIITWRSGLGDLVSNLSAVRDWRLAHEDRGEEIDDFACLTSEAAALAVIEDDADLESMEYRQKLIRGLILSGVAMEMAGSSRPASGSEHLISHALDELLDAPRLHGLQVALGTVAACVLRGEDCSRTVRFFRLMGLPVRPEELGVDSGLVLEAVRRGPATRPGRTTFLDQVTETEIGWLRDAYRSGVL